MRHTEKRSDVRNADNCPIKGRDYQFIVDLYSNPDKPGTPAAKLNAIIRNRSRSCDLVQEWIATAASKAVDKGLTLTPALLTYIAKHTSKEAIIHQALGVPVNLIRAGCLFERRRMAEEPNGRALPFARMADIWDMAITDEMARQVAHNTTVRWLPLADGTSSNPNSDRRLTCGGLAEWLTLTRGSNPDADTRRNGEREWTPADTQGSRGSGTFTPTAEWLAEHHITREMLASIGRQGLADLGVDASILDEPVEAARVMA